jgi:hypothetical protein
MNWYLFQIHRDGKTYQVEISAESQMEAEEIISPIPYAMFVAEGVPRPDGTGVSYLVQMPERLQ